MIGLRTATLLVGLASAASARAGVEPPARDIRLVIGPGATVVREIREIAFTSAVHDVLLTGIPPEADVGSLQAGGARLGVSLVEWRRPAPPRARVDVMTADAEGWTFRGDDVPALPVDAVLCRLEGAPGRTRRVEFSYVLTGLTWRAEYEISIRGDLWNHLEQLSLDLDGRVVISNGTDRAFDGALVEMVADFAPPPAEDSPGLLALDDVSPLADLWRTPPVAPRVPRLYRLPAAVSIPARGEVAAPLVAVSRQPAERAYRMVSEQFPPGAADTWRPLTRFLSFRNARPGVQTLPLPPGPALVYVGGVRGGIYQRAAIGHTEPGAEIDIDLGPAVGVTGQRSVVARAEEGAAIRDQTIALRIANTLPTAIRLQISERPPVPLAWDVIRSSKPYDRRGQRLEYRLSIDARSEETIEYVVRVTEPAL